MRVRAVDKPDVSTTGGLPSALDAGVEGTAALHRVAQMMAVVSRMNGTRTLPETVGFANRTLRHKGSLFSFPRSFCGFASKGYINRTHAVRVFRQA